MDATLPRTEPRTEFADDSPDNLSASWASRILCAPLAPTVCSLTLLAAAMFNPLDVGFRAIDEEHSVGLDWQVGLKLIVSAIACGVGLLGWIGSPKVRHALMTLPGTIFVALGFVFLGTSVFALDEVANVCRAAAIIYCGYVLFVPTALAMLNLRTIVVMILIGLVMHMVVSWFLYLFVPSIGVYEEELAGATLVPRMSGTAHPNSVGRVGVLSIVIAISLLRAVKLPPLSGRGRLLMGVLIFAGIATAIETMSRTAMAAGIAAAALMMSDLIPTRRGMLIALTSIVLFCGGLLLFGLTNGTDQISDVLVSAGTKTGDADELTSATGRTRIWAEAISLIAQRPLTGWGLNSAPVLLAEFSQHTHNLLLHAFFSGGILAGGLVILLVLWTAIVGLTSREPLVRGVAAYVLVSGCFEDTVIETFPFSSTLLWLTVLFAPVVYQNRPWEVAADRPLRADSSEA